MIGEERFRRDFTDILWHTNTPAEEYRELASRFGIAIDKGFHCDGWQHERAEDSINMVDQFSFSIFIPTITRPRWAERSGQFVYRN